VIPNALLVNILYRKIARTYERKEKTEERKDKSTKRKTALPAASARRKTPDFSEVRG